jgi:hypothetical protein
VRLERDGRRSYTTHNQHKKTADSTKNSTNDAGNWKNKQQTAFPDRSEA